LQGSAPTLAAHDFIWDKPLRHAVAVKIDCNAPQRTAIVIDKRWPNIIFNILNRDSGVNLRMVRRMNMLHQ
jgi:hypothetical protein